MPVALRLVGALVRASLPLVFSTTMALTIDGQVIQGPRGGSPAAEVVNKMFTDFETLYDWPASVSKYLKEVVGIKTTYDFITAFRTEKDWDKFFDAEIREGQIAVGRGVKGRVVQAFEAIVDAQKLAAKNKALGEDNADLDVPLGSGEIKAQIVRFWSKHKVKPPSAKFPGDLLISRLTREMDRRFLHLADMYKVKGIETERRAQSKKHELGHGLQFNQDAAEVEELRPSTVSGYLDGMDMYMLGLAIWGSKPLDNAPDPVANPETRDTNPEDYVHFPWQFSIDYCHRANKFSMDALAVLPTDQVLAMLEKRDREERSIWVAKIRESEKLTLGQIFKVTFEKREQRWIFDAEKKPTQGSGSANQTGAPDPAAQGKHHGSQGEADARRGRWRRRWRWRQR